MAKVNGLDHTQSAYVVRAVVSVAANLTTHVFTTLQTRAPAKYSCNRTKLFMDDLTSGTNPL